MASAPAASAEASGSEAPVHVLGRTVAVLRAPFFGVPPAERARRTEGVIKELIAKGGPGEVTVQHEPLGSVFLIDGQYALLLTPNDVDPVRRESMAAVSKTVEAALRQALEDGKESRDRRRTLKAVLWAAGGTLAFGFAAWLILRLRVRLVNRATHWLAEGAARAKVGGRPLWHTFRLRVFAAGLVNAVAWLIVAVLLYQWLVFVLTRFPITRAMGERLGSLLFDAVAHVFGGVLAAIPDLLVALVILGLAKLITNAARPIFDRIAHGQLSWGWIDANTVAPTRRLFQVAVWLFAVAMAYPYLPGSGTEAFKGISVLVGVMITVGGSGLVGQGASGLILIYSRTLRVGEFVRINEHEGTVTELGTFTTKIRTGLGEELSIPNSVMLATTTKNYSRAVEGQGFVVDTVVTIGYDTPWRQVHELLLDGARRTEGVLEKPSPRVFQTALSDFYVEYRLVAQAVPSEPRPRAEVISQLHANVLDAFNEAGVQIMSPHYLGDPAEPKVVAAERRAS